MATLCGGRSCIWTTVEDLRIKQPGAALDKISTYTYAIQDLARHFNHLLSAHNENGLVVCDSRLHRENRQVSHSVFTRSRGGIVVSDARGLRPSRDLFGVPARPPAAAAEVSAAARP